MRLDKMYLCDLTGDESPEIILIVSDNKTGECWYGVFTCLEPDEYYSTRKIAEGICPDNNAFAFASPQSGALILGPTGKGIGKYVFLRFSGETLEEEKTSYLDSFSNYSEYTQGSGWKGNYSFLSEIKAKDLLGS